MSELSGRVQRWRGAGQSRVHQPRVRSLAQEVCKAEDLTGHGPYGSVSGDVSLLVR